MRRALLAAGAGLLLGAMPVRAQDSTAQEPPTAAVVQGRVITPAGEKVTPVPGVMVTLHRVGPDHAGPVDSVRSGADGRYTIRYTRGGSPDAVWFAAVLHRGIAYFSAPLRMARVTAEEGEIVVFDTTSRAVPLSVQGHHVVIGAPGPDGTRKVVEVYELSNDTTVTLVGTDSTTPVWSTALPARATQFEGGQGDVAATSIEVRSGRVVLLAPFGPGLKQLSYSYVLPPAAFPLQFTTDRYTGVLEVLLEEPAAQVRGKSLRTQGDATTQGRTFKRFISQGTPAGEEVRIDVPVVAASTRSRVLVGLAVAIALVMGGALALALRKRGRRVAVPVAVPRSEALVAAIATLDARRESGDAGLSADAYASERASLKLALAAALAEERR